MGLALISTVIATRRRVLSAVGLVALLAVACGGSSGDSPGDSVEGTAGATPDSVSSASGSASDEEKPARQRSVLKPEIADISNWINSEPTTIEAETARGNVVLIDFWTYTCVNCIRTMPHLRAWQEKYGGRGLSVVGVHSPECEFEKITKNVEEAIERLGVTWRVAQDNDMATWRKFGNRFWPAKYLFSVDDELVYSHFGEGEYAETEKQIREQLIAAGNDISDIPFEPLPGDVRDVAATKQTRELYGGYARAYSQQGVYNGHEEYYWGPDQVLDYTDDGERVEGQYFLMGLWGNREESIVHARQDPGLEDYLRVPFSARSVNIVIEPAGPEPFEVVVEIDGQPPTKEHAGAAIVWKNDGTTVLEVAESRLYAVLESPEFTQAELHFRSTSPNFAMFAFTFGIYLEGA